MYEIQAPVSELDGYKLVVAAPHLQALCSREIIRSRRMRAVPNERTAGEQLISGTRFNVKLNPHTPHPAK